MFPFLVRQRRGALGGMDMMGTADGGAARCAMLMR